MGLINKIIKYFKKESAPEEPEMMTIAVRDEISNPPKTEYMTIPKEPPVEFYEELFANHPAEKIIYEILTGKKVPVKDKDNYHNLKPKYEK